MSGDSMLVIWYGPLSGSVLFGPDGRVATFTARGGTSFIRLSSLYSLTPSLVVAGSRSTLSQSVLSRGAETADRVRISETNLCVDLLR